MEESKTFSEIAPYLQYLVYAFGVVLAIYFLVWAIKKERPEIQVSPIGRYALVFIGLNIVTWLVWYWAIDSEPQGLQTFKSALVAAFLTLVYIFIDYTKNKGQASA